MGYPIKPVIKPKVLSSYTNGKLPNEILEDIIVAGYPTIRLLKDTSARAWKAMYSAARIEGIVLSATSLFDSYRPYLVQERIFKERYSKLPISGRPTKTWNGVKYWLRPGYATAAVPGTSNHGLALAVDNTNTSKLAINWLLENADKFGWSWELDSEPWHLRYYSGDKIPNAVIEFEKPNNDPLEDDMIQGFDKSPEDVARATIRELCDVHWGKGKMSVDEQKFLLEIWRGQGREAMMIKLLDDTQNTI